MSLWNENKPFVASIAIGLILSLSVLVTDLDLFNIVYAVMVSGVIFLLMKIWSMDRFQEVWDQQQDQGLLERSADFDEAKEIALEWGEKHMDFSVYFDWNKNEFDKVALGDDYLVYYFYCYGAGDKEVIIYVNGTSRKVAGYKLANSDDRILYPFKYSDFVQNYYRQMKANKTDQSAPVQNGFMMPNMGMPPQGNPRKMNQGSNNGDDASEGEEE